MALSYSSNSSLSSSSTSLAVVPPSTSSTLVPITSVPPISAFHPRLSSLSTGTVNERRNASAARLPHNQSGTTQFLERAASASTRAAHISQQTNRPSTSRSARGRPRNNYPWTSLMAGPGHSQAPIIFNVALIPWPVRLI